MVTQVHVHPAQARFAGLQAAPEQRTRAFRAARRHSMFVSLLKVLLPFSAMAVGGLYVLPRQWEVPVGPGNITVPEIKIDSGGLKMVNPSYKGAHEKYGAYDVRADSGLQQITDPSVITFDKITADLVSPQNEKTTLTAPSGIFHSKKGELTFDNGVIIDGEAGIAGQLKKATAYMKENRLVSTTPVTLRYHGHTIESQSLEVWTAEGRAIFTGQVKVHLERAQTEGKQQ